MTRGLRPHESGASVTALVPRSAGPGRGAPDVRVPPHHRQTLASGARLVIVPRHDVPLVAFCAILRGGGRSDPAGHAGVSALYAGLLGKGGGHLDAFEFADAVEEAGGSFTAFATADHIVVSGQFLAQHQERMLELLAGALLAPRAPREELEKVRARQIELLKAARDSDPGELLSAYGRAFLFRRHPYGRPVMGSERSLAALGPDDVERYRRSHFGGDRLALIFAGDVDEQWLTSAAAKAFGAVRPAGMPLPCLPSPPRLRRRRVLLVDRPQATQSYFWIGGPGVDKRYERRAALDLVNILLGGRFTSLLNGALRIRSGLSYEAASSFTRGAVSGEFAIRALAETRRTVQAVDLALGTLTRLASRGVSADMLESARAYALGQYPLSLETAGDWAFAFGELEAYGLPPDYIEGYGPALRGVTLEDTRRVIAEAFPAPDRVALVVVGDAQALRDPLARYGPVLETSLSRPGFSPPH
ncbi:MAG: M16 family metallopeptidase [Steroidobacteraceae bacterium]